MKFQAVLFDLDGTLLDTLEDLADSANIALQRLGFPGHDVDAYRYFVGDGLEVMVRRALRSESRRKAVVRECMDAVREEYAKRWSRKTRPYPEIPELLDALVACGVKMCVLSNKPDDFTRLTVAELLSRWDFAAVRGARDGVPLKPDPAAALQIADELPSPPQKLIYVGDTNIDMKTAVAADMYPVGALWGFRTAEELTANGARTLIAKPTELLKLLG